MRNTRGASKVPPSPNLYALQRCPRLFFQYEWWCMDAGSGHRGHGKGFYCCVLPWRTNPLCPAGETFVKYYCRATNCILSLSLSLSLCAGCILLILCPIFYPLHLTPPSPSSSLRSPRFLGSHPSVVIQESVI